MKNKIILASASPRRLDLLSQIGITVDAIVPADIDETILKNELPKALALRLCQAKCAKIAALHPDAFVIAADTVVACGRRILDKPKDADDARKTLNILAGRRHKVYTGHCIAAPNGRIKSRICETTVSFRGLSSAEIEIYVQGRDWEGKAGGYGIQGPAAMFVKFLSGSHSNVLGLSLYDTMQMLNVLGYKKD